MNSRNALDGLPAKLYRRSPLFYWKRFVLASPGVLSFGGRHYGEDFWFQLNRGWFDIHP
jgi:hypothetical protein